MKNEQLKFRCWDKVNKKFVPPSHIAINGNGILLITDSGMYEKLQNKNYCNVDQEHVVQQFTGLLDKNKKEIYEGDIIENGTENYQIEYKNGGFIAGNYPLVFLITHSEIVGNIYEKLQT
jgi:uncharacterized phage protein (TIGR01671 family)